MKRYRVKLLDRAMREYAVARTWWRTYRQGAPNALRDELYAARELLSRNTELIDERWPSVPIDLRSTPRTLRGSSVPATLGRGHTHAVRYAPDARRWSWLGRLPRRGEIEQRFRFGWSDLDEQSAGVLVLINRAHWSDRDEIARAQTARFTATHSERERTSSRSSIVCLPRSRARPKSP